MRLREATAGVIVAFVLNWVWENLQAFLYQAHGGPIRQIWICTVATFGDLALVALIFAAVAVVWRDSVWHRRGSVGRYGAAILVGVAIAVGIEYWALASGRWAYGRMPLIPFTEIGLVPVLQMILLPPLAFASMRRAAAGTGAMGHR